MNFIFLKNHFLFQHGLVVGEAYRTTLVLGSPFSIILHVSPVFDMLCPRFCLSLSLFTPLFWWSTSYRCFLRKDIWEVHFFETLSKIYFETLSKIYCETLSKIIIWLDRIIGWKLFFIILLKLLPHCLLLPFSIAVEKSDDTILSLSFSLSFISCRILLSPCFEILWWCALVCVSCIYSTVLGIQWVLSNWESMSLSLESYDELFLWWLSLHSFLQVFSGTRRFRCWTPRSGLLIFFFLFYCSVFLLCVFEKHSQLYLPHSNWVFHFCVIY